MFIVMLSSPTNDPVNGARPSLLKQEMVEGEEECMIILESLSEFDTDDGVTMLKQDHL